MMRLARVVFTSVLSMLVFAGAAGTPALGREARLAIYPAGLSTDGGEHSLLPEEESLVEGDAVALYEKAGKTLPGELKTEQITDWLNMPIEQLPLRQAEAMLQQHMESLKLAARGARSKECNWPQWKPGSAPDDQEHYRELAFIVALRARHEMAQGQYEGAVLTLQTGFGMARHLGRAPTLLHTLIGAAVGGVMCAELEQFVQGENAPNLYHAFDRLPAPLVEVERAIENETQAGLAKISNETLRQQLERQLGAAHNRARLVARRLDTNLAALQCVEALRAYAASHKGSLPQKLSEIGDIPLPPDPFSDRPFEYERKGLGAVLASVVPSGGNEVDMTRYEIALRRRD